MKILAEIFRLDDMRRASAKVWVPFAAWAVAAVFTNLILILAQWPAAPWRFLAAFMVGIMAYLGARWFVFRLQRKAARPTSVK